MIRMLRGWVDNKLYEMYQSMEQENKDLRVKYKELEEEHAELLGDYSKKVEEVNDLKMEKIERENPNFSKAEKEGNLE